MSAVLTTTIETVVAGAKRTAIRTTPSVTKERPRRVLKLKVRWRKQRGRETKTRLAMSAFELARPHPQLAQVIEGIRHVLFKMRC